jgi:hypothetical protein
VSGSERVPRPSDLRTIRQSARPGRDHKNKPAGYAASFDRRTGEIRLTVLGMPALELGDSIAASDAPESELNASGYVKGLRHRFGFLEGFVTDIVVSAETGA